MPRSPRFPNGHVTVQVTGRSGRNAFPAPAWQRFLKTGACHACRVPGWSSGSGLDVFERPVTGESLVKTDAGPGPGPIRRGGHAVRW